MSIPIEEAFTGNKVLTDSSLESPSFALLPVGEGLNTHKGGDFCDESSYVVKLKDDVARAYVRFADPVTVRGSIIGKLSVWLEYPDGEKTDAFMQRVTLGEGRDSLSRQLKEAFPITGGWTLVLSQVFEGISVRMREMEMRSVKSVAEIVPSKSFHLLEPFIEHGVANLFFAKGSTGKTTFTIGMAVAVIVEAEFLGVVPTRRVRTLFIDYEGSEASFRDKVERIGFGTPGWRTEMMTEIFYKESNGLPLHELADDLRALVIEKDIGLIIIDSAVPAIGGAPEDAACASLYFNALRKIGVTSITIGHEPKNSTDGLTAFGSVFFMNLSRNVWNLSSDETFDGATKTVTAKHRKYNNGPLVRDILYKMTSVPSSITFTLDDAQRDDSKKVRIVESLRLHGKQSLAEIASVTLIAPETVRKTIARLEKDGIVKTDGKGKRSLV